jgi:hypothetical protein
MKKQPTEHYAEYRTKGDFSSVNLLLTRIAAQINILALNGIPEAAVV